MRRGCDSRPYGTGWRERGENRGAGGHHGGAPARAFDRCHGHEVGQALGRSQHRSTRCSPANRRLRCIAYGAAVQRCGRAEPDSNRLPPGVTNRDVTAGRRLPASRRRSKLAETAGWRLAADVGCRGDVGGDDEVAMSPGLVLWRGLICVPTRTRGQRMVLACDPIRFEAAA